jgi:hypothetical protein
VVIYVNIRSHNKPGNTMNPTTDDTPLKGLPFDGREIRTDHFDRRQLMAVIRSGSDTPWMVPLAREILGCETLSGVILICVGGSNTPIGMSPSMYGMLEVPDLDWSAALDKLRSIAEEESGKTATVTYNSESDDKSQQLWTFS